jgi:adenosylmethionine-8-amino-7-oxononanoate aminotransferase
MIADEIATGFGRTGKMFAIEHANIKPDIMLLAKGLTAGFMTLSAVITSDKVYERIKGSDIPKIMHGPTFMANPLALSCAIASIDEFFRVDALSLVQNIEKTLSEKLLNLAEKPHVKDIRVLGACAAIELDQPVKIYQMQNFLIERGVWLRPFGNVIYLFPPFVISKKELSKLIEVTVNLVDALPTIFASS